MEELHCQIYGRVQMVMFRDFVARHARSLGLVGYVRNRDHDSVEVVAQGPKESLDKLLIYLHKGSLLSRVERVDVAWRDQTSPFDAFTIQL